jgi:hypothetical protein
MSVGTGRQKIISLEIAGSFKGIHKWEPYIYIGFSPARHLLGGVEPTSDNLVLYN